MSNHFQYLPNKMNLGERLALHKDNRDATNANALRHGSRVTGVFYGVRKNGTVIKPTTSSVVHVLWDNATGTVWCHRDSLTLIAR